MYADRRGNVPAEARYTILDVALRNLLLALLLPVGLSMAADPVPKHYDCVRASKPVTIDGKLNDGVWKRAAWTDWFVDIRGGSFPEPRFRTRAKMLWDDNYFYVAAELVEPHVWATLTEHDSVIFHDPDFEVFIDPDGDNHNYYEFEMNALNTIWELTLDKPYRDGGPAHLGDNLPGLRSAVHIDGTLNNPSDTDRGWSVEIAFPFKSLARYATAMPCPPKDGDRWRINFSRVEWLIDILDGRYRKVPKEAHPEDNWVWSPQGVIDMHRPERWGYIQFFTAAPGTAKFRPDPALPARDRLMDVYYRQKAFLKQHRRYATNLAELGLDGSTIHLTISPNGYDASTLAANGRVLHIREDSRLWAAAR